MTSITFNGKNSWTDFGFYVEEKTINPPSKIKILETVPYMDSSYDFSTTGSNGEPVYGTRTVIIKLGILNCNSMEELQTKYIQAISWLVDCGQSQLIFSWMPNYYFLAEVNDAPSFDDFVDNGDLSVTFVCEPFRYSVNYMGSDIWDDINFLTDYMQETNVFNINGSTNVVMCNNGRSVTPILNCSIPMTCTFNNQTYNLMQGDNTPYGMKLQTGINNLTFNCTSGIVTIIFRNEVI